MKSLLDLTFHDCRWPVGEQDGKHFFCAAPRDGKSSYCVKHRQIAKGKSTFQPFVSGQYRREKAA